LIEDKEQIKEKVVEMLKEINVIVNGISDRD